MESLRITILRKDDYESFVIPDLEIFLERLKRNPKIADKYKRMDSEEFRQWVRDDITPEQFKKLKKLNDL